MVQHKGLKVEKVAKFKEDITKKKIIQLHDFLDDLAMKFFEQQCKTEISVYHSVADRVSYDNLEEFQKNFSNSQGFEKIILHSTGRITQMIYVDITCDALFNGSEYPVSSFIYINCDDKTEIEVEDLLQEIKEFVCNLFSHKTPQNIYSTEVYINTDTDNAQPTDHSNEKFWIKHKPLLDFLYLVLGIVISVATIIGLFKSCNDDTINNEINENQTLYSQQNEISSDSDKTSLLS